MGHLVIIRGLPGSGKSTLARNIARDNGSMHIEADMLLMSDGVYHYTPIGHDRAKHTIRRIVFIVGSEGADLIVSGVLPTANSVYQLVNVWHMADTISPAWHDYTRPSCTIIDLAISIEASFRRNTHMVPIVDIEGMHEAWVRANDIKDLSKFTPLEIQEYDAEHPIHSLIIGSVPVPPPTI